jgi:hypothetical protein
MKSYLGEEYLLGSAAQCRLAQFEIEWGRVGNLREFSGEVERGSSCNGMIRHGKVSRR